MSTPRNSILDLVKIFLVGVLLLLTACKGDGEVFSTADTGKTDFSFSAPLPQEVVLVSTDFITPNPLTIFVGNFAKPNLEATFSNDAKYRGLTDTLMTIYQEEPLFIDWYSEDEGIVSVDEFGTVTGISAGEAVITAFVGENFSATTTIIVE